MTDREALLRSVVESPNDDGPRLIYADWLEETGDPERAEFIRIQCETHSVPMPDERWKALVQRADQLFRLNQGRWQQELPGHPAVQWPGRFYRGFPHQAAASRWGELKAVWTQMFAVTPLVQLTIHAIAPWELDDLLSQPETRFLQYVFLRIDGRIDLAAERLAASPAPAGWTALQLRPDEDDFLTDTGARALVKSPYLGGLNRLHVPTGRLSVEARQALQQRFGDALL
ncbi:MAG TPA: TIGR02996 domain-containing protein [Gemmataceae bacterium]|nr:TIGR02996 domain-containing protein [Gemmataceae bacterium]